jgi:hypothetical protein
MIKHFCDACKSEIKGRGKNTYSGPCHLLEEDKRGKLGYVDADHNPVSGRDVSFDLCNRCSNEVHGAASKALYAIIEKHKAYPPQGG